MKGTECSKSRRESSLAALGAGALGSASNDTQKSSQHRAITDPDWEEAEAKFAGQVVAIKSPSWMQVSSPATPPESQSEDSPGRQGHPWTGWVRTAQIVQPCSHHVTRLHQKDSVRKGDLGAQVGSRPRKGREAGTFQALVSAFPELRLLGTR